MSSALLASLLALQTPAAPAPGAAPAEARPMEFERSAGALRVRVKESIIGFNDPAMNEESFIASPDGHHMAYMIMAGEGLAVVSDGEQGETFEGIASGSLVYSASGQHLGFVGTRPSKQYVVLDGQAHEYDGVSTQGIVFSPDGSRSGWVGAREGHQIAVIDGVESPPYDGIHPHGILFSSDGKRSAYAATSAGKQLVVLDGEEGPLFEHIAELRFTTGGKHLAYSARREQRWFVVLDGTTLGPYDELRSAGQKKADENNLDPFQVSADGSRVGFLGTRGEEWFAVIDGQERGPYRGCTALSFSPEGSRTAYVATRGEGWFLVLDGQESKGVLFQGLTFSPDGKRTALVVRRGEKQLVVLDGVEGKEYDRIEEPGVIFSPDGKRATYLASLGADRFVVTDGQEGAPLKRLGSTGLGFLPDSALVSYSVRRGDKEALVVNGVEGPPASGFRHVTSGAGGTRYAYAVEHDKNHWTVVIDGEEYGPGGKIPAGGERTYYQSLGKRTPLFSPDGKRTAYTAVRNGRYVVVVDGVEGPEFDMVMRGTVDFTPDGKHFVYVAARGADKKTMKWSIMVDGLELDNGWTGFLQDSDFVFHDAQHLCIRASRQPRRLLLELELATF